MRDKLIKLLGGFTSPEVSKLIFESDRNREVLTQLVALKDIELSNLRERINELKEEVNLYRTKVFEDHGITQKQETISSETQNFEPINKSETWVARRRRLEKEDALKAKAQKEAVQQVDKTQEYWEKKNAS